MFDTMIFILFHINLSLHSLQHGQLRKTFNSFSFLYFLLHNPIFHFKLNDFFIFGLLFN